VVNSSRPSFVSADLDVELLDVDRGVNVVLDEFLR